MSMTFALIPQQKALSKWGVGAMLLLASLTLNLVGNGRISLWDRDEPRYAQASRQMLESEEWVVPKFNTDNRYDKPVLIYWLMAASMKVFGVNEFSARLPAAIAGSLTVLIVFLLALRMGCEAGSAALAALITMTGVLLLGVSKAATTDSVLTLTVVAMMSLLWRQLQAPFSWLYHVLIFVVLGASALLKGPPGLLILSTAAITFKIWQIRQEGKSGINWRVHFIRCCLGIAVFLAVSMPWAVLAWQRTGGDFFKVAIGHHVVERSMKPLESHGGSFLLCLPFYIPVLLIGVFPWTAPALLGLRHAWRRKQEPAFRFLWCWLIPSFVVFSLVQTKLPHYIAPLLPAVALMTALWWRNWNEVAQDQPHPMWWRFGAIITALLGVGAAGSLVGVSIYLNYHALLVPSALAALLLASACGWGAINWWRVRPQVAMTIWCVMIVLLSLVTYLWILPSVESLKPSKSTATWILKHTPPGAYRMAAEYREPTLVFYLGAPVEMLGNSKPEIALARLREKSHPAVLITTRKRWEKWSKEFPELISAADIAYKQKSYIFQRGIWEDILIIINWHQ